MTRSASRRPLAAMAAVLCAHVLLLFWLGHRIPHGLAAPAVADDPAIELTVVHWPASPPAPIALGRIRLPSGPAPAPVTAPSAPPLATAALPPPPIDAPGAAGPDSERLRSTLRGLVGCAQPEAYGLNRDERQACDHRTATPAPVQVQIDAKAQSAFEAESRSEPLLVRKPKNGCLPRAADRASAVASRGARSGAITTAGVGCAWSF